MTENKFKHSLVKKISYALIRFTVGNLVNLIWVKKVYGLDNLPKEGAAIIASNHTSYFDFLVLASVLPRQVHFIAGEVFFTNILWLPLMKMTSQIKVDRNSKDKSETLEKVFDALNKGFVVGIFPEGTRSLNGEIQKAHTGVVRISQKSNAPIIPIGIDGAFDVMSKKDKRPRFKKVIRVNIGKPIYPESAKDPGHEEIQMKLNKLMSEIVKLRDANHG